MRQLTYVEILAIIANECRNGCTDLSSTYRHLKNHHPDQTNDATLIPFLNILNFSAIRENSVELEKALNQ